MNIAYDYLDWPYNLMAALNGVPISFEIGYNEMQLLYGSMVNLSPREQRCIFMYYKEIPKCTLEMVGKELGVTRERARQIIVKALRKILRHPNYNKLIKHDEPLNDRDPFDELRILINRKFNELDSREQVLKKKEDRIRHIMLKYSIPEDIFDLSDYAYEKLYGRTNFSESIDLLNLSVRSYNGLKRNGFDTIDKLICYIEKEDWAGITSIRNIGPRSYQEIKEKLNEYTGLNL